MSGFGAALRRLFGSDPPQKKRRPKAKAYARQVRTTSTARQRQTCRPTASRASPPKPKAQVVQQVMPWSPIPYWQLRGWRCVADKLYLGYFKTRLGRCHGVIKWVSPANHSIYVHDVPKAILSGPHGSCFTEVKRRKYRVHFAQQPTDLNGAIFYIETLLQEAFKT